MGRAKQLRIFRVRPPMQPSIRHGKPRLSASANYPKRENFSRTSGDVSFLRKQESRLLWPAPVFLLATRELEDTFLDSRFRGNDT